MNNEDQDPRPRNRSSRTTAVRPPGRLSRGRGSSARGHTPSEAFAEAAQGRVGGGIAVTRRTRAGVGIDPRRRGHHGPTRLPQKALLARPVPDRATSGGRSRVNAVGPELGDLLAADPARPDEPRPAEGETHHVERRPLELARPPGLGSRRRRSRESAPTRQVVDLGNLELGRSRPGPGVAPRARRTFPGRDSKALMTWPPGSDRARSAWPMTAAGPDGPAMSRVRGAPGRTSIAAAPDPATERPSDYRRSTRSQTR